jgi:hypothetical protein
MSKCDGIVPANYVLLLSPLEADEEDNGYVMKRDVDWKWKEGDKGYIVLDYVGNNQYRVKPIATHLALAQGTIMPCNWIDELYTKTFGRKGTGIKRPHNMNKANTPSKRYRNNKGSSTIPPSKKKKNNKHPTRKSSKKLTRPQHKP